MENVRRNETEKGNKGTCERNKQIDRQTDIDR